MNAKLVGLVLLAGCVADAGATKQVRCIDETGEVKASMGHLRDGQVAMGKRDYSAAIGLLQQAVDVEPRNHVAWYQLGRAYDAQHDFDQAAKAYEHATALAEGAALYWLQLGLARYEDGLTQGLTDLDSVKRPLEQAIVLNPRLYRAHHTLGVMAASAQNPIQAAEAFQRAIEAAPHVPDSYVALGELYLAWGYTVEATKVLEAGVANGTADQTGPDRATVLLALGRARRDAGEDARAVLALSGALDDQPDLREARFERGMAYFATKELAKAKQDLQEFQKTASRDQLAWDIAETTLAAIRDQEVR